MLTPDRHLAHVRRDVDRVQALLSPESLSADVPACPGWTVRDLATHLGAVHRMVTAAVAEQRATRSKHHLPRDPISDRELSSWLREGSGAMLAALDADPETPAWSFVESGRSVGFWQRRQAMENLVHRVDVEQALGLDSAIDPELAADGVGEVVDVLIPMHVGIGVLAPPERGAIVLRTLDTDDSWTLGTGPVRATIEADAADLLLALWQRRAPETVTDDRAALQLLRSPLTP